MLDYLFTAAFDDGTALQQNPDDISLIEPATRSCFYDLVQAQEAGKILMLFSLSNGDNVYTLDLRDGYFFVNDIPFRATPEGFPGDFSALRLIYHRTHQHHFNPDFTEVGHDMQYVFGWQTTIGSKNYQQTLTIE